MEKSITNDELLKLIASEMLKVEEAPTKRLDIFTPGLYTRHLRMPANSVFVTEKHNSVHQYFVMYGEIHVWDEKNGWKLIHAPYTGVTYPGTQRLFRTYDENVIWVTAHPTDIFPEDNSTEAHEAAVEKITNKIISRYNYVLNEPVEMEEIQ